MAFRSFCKFRQTPFTRTNRCRSSVHQQLLSTFAEAKLRRLSPRQDSSGKILTGYQPFLSQVVAEDLLTSIGENACVSLLHTRSVADAVHEMKENDIGSVVILSDNDRVVGILTERDYLQKVHVKGRDPLRTNVSSIMTENPCCAEPSDSMNSCIQFMLVNNARHLPVVEFGEEDQFELDLPTRARLLGMISVNDIVRKINELELTAIQSSSAGSKPIKVLFDSSQYKTDRPIVRSSDLVMNAIKLIAQSNIGAVLVYDKGAVAGVFSERDFIRKISSADSDFSSTIVEDVMTSDLVTVTEDASVHECLTLMAQKGFRHLPVFDRDNIEFRGILSVRDLLKSIMSN